MRLTGAVGFRSGLRIDRKTVRMTVTFNGDKDASAAFSPAGHAIELITRPHLPSRD
ncbi:hypothetical protein ACFFWC_22350 [Plantactinospora siamensis]|uniref:Uncharacterized protein n=1 Tax=Plantactinospora siamensis TaxID=555372 RepID=A0ABV6NYD9_9ACTN